MKKARSSSRKTKTGFPSDLLDPFGEAVACCADTAAVAEVLCEACSGRQAEPLDPEVVGRVGGIIVENLRRVGELIEELQSRLAKE